MGRQNTFGGYIARRRKTLGMTQADLAGKIGVSKSAVAKWETNGGIPDRENQKALSGVLQIPVDEMYHIIEGDEGTFSEINITQDVISALQSRGYRVIPEIKSERKG